MIKERRTQRPEARAAARNAAIKAGKDKKAASDSQKKAEKAKTASKAAQGGVRNTLVGKQQSKGAQTKVAANTR